MFLILSSCFFSISILLCSRSLCCSSRFFSFCLMNYYCLSLFSYWSIRLRSYRSCFFRSSFCKSCYSFNFLSSKSLYWTRAYSSCLRLSYSYRNLLAYSYCRFFSSIYLRFLYYFSCCCCIFSSFCFRISYIFISYWIVCSIYFCLFIQIRTCFSLIFSSCLSSFYIKVDLLLPFREDCIMVLDFYA